MTKHYSTDTRIYTVSDESVIPNHVLVLSRLIDSMEVIDSQIMMIDEVPNYILGGKKDYLKRFNFN